MNKDNIYVQVSKDDLNRLKRTENSINNIVQVFELSKESSTKGSDLVLHYTELVNIRQQLETSVVLLKELLNKLPEVNSSSEASKTAKLTRMDSGKGY